MKVQSSYRIYLHKKAFGKGPYDLLKAIEETGAISKAAKLLNLSYSKAHKILKECEEGLGFTLLTREIGGIGGGGSVLTDQAKTFLKDYAQFVRDMECIAEEKAKEYFSKYDQ